MVHVLIVEQHWRRRELIMNVLAEAGYSVDEASDGRLAIDRARQRPPDVVVFHRETYAREFLAARRDSPTLDRTAVVVASGRPTPLPGVAVYLKKPFTVDDLLAALQRCRERAERQGMTFSVVSAASEQPGS